MFKKLTLGVMGLAIVGGILFGGNLVPYATTAFNKARTAAESQVPISFQIEAAEQQMNKIQPEVQKMVHQIAIEKVAAKRLENELSSSRKNLDSSYDEMITLRGHLESGKEYYTAANAKTYTNSRVKEDLQHRFAIYKTAKQTIENKEQVLASRKAAIDAAIAKLEEAQTLQRELQVTIENLKARNRVNEVAKQATSIDIDDSELAQTARMVEDIGARIDADTELLNMAPKYFGQIPVNEDSVLSDKDILQEMDEFFNVSAEEMVSN